MPTLEVEVNERPGSLCQSGQIVLRAGGADRSETLIGVQTFALRSA